MKTHTLFPAVPVLLSTLICLPSVADDTEVFAFRGQSISTTEAATLEERLQEHPGDIDSRAKLLGYYRPRTRGEPKAREARRRHVLWFIENAPEAAVLGSLYAELDPVSDAETSALAKGLWLEQLKKKPDNLPLIANALQFVQLRDHELAEELIKRAKSLDPQNPTWPYQLGYLYFLDALRSTRAIKEMAAKAALNEYELAQKLSPESRRIHLLEEIARAALEANELVKARTYAERLLEAAEDDHDRPDWIHTGNTVLGRIALRKGDVEKAKAHLIASGKIRGSATLSTFGPDMSLAKELLERGERQAVLDYFVLCAGFWEMNRGRLRYWSSIVEEGGVPDFESFPPDWEESEESDSSSAEGFRPLPPSPSVVEQLGPDELHKLFTR